MFKFDWNAAAAYAPSIFLTLIAVFGILKDSKDYKARPRVGPSTKRERVYRRMIVPFLYVLTFLVLIFSVMNTHASREKASKSRAEAQAQQARYEGQISSLQVAVNTGNKMLGGQRKDFLGQFVDMSKRVEKLQAEVKTSDLQQEAASLKADLDATRHSMEKPKATLQFSFVDKEPFVVLLPMLTI